MRREYLPFESSLSPCFDLPILLVACNVEILLTLRQTEQLQAYGPTGHHTGRPM
jgi:hypothetical protein